jgi:serine/threonine-protein kinase
VHYISPEQAKGGRVDDRSDIYSLGTVMYEMMTGRPPYDGESPVAVAIQHINGGAKAPSSLNANIPGGMEQIIMRAMAHDPADRYNSAGAMLQDMDEFRRNPAVLFDYHTPPTDAVTTIIPMQPKRKPTTAQRVAASSQRRPQQPRREPAPQPKPRPQRVERNYEMEDDRSKAATIAIISCSVVAIIAIVIFLFVLFGGGSNPDNGLVAVPTLVGKNYENLTISNDFVIKAPNYQHSDTHEKGQIIDQTPEPGTKVARGTEIHIWISLGPEPKVKVMENLVGQERTTAENYLDGQGVLFLCTAEASDTVPEGYVIRTEPEVGTTLQEGQTVMLYISTGPEIRTGKMPKLTGQSLETARTILDNQNLQLDVKEMEEHSSDVEANLIIRSEPEAGAELKSGDTVVIYISKGPETAKMPSVVGETLETALKMLSAAGFDNVDYEAQVESELPEGSVAEQSVAAGEQVAITEKILLTISTGPQITKEVTFQLIEDMGDAYSVKIIRQDTGEVVYDGTVSGDRSSLAVTVTGKGVVIYEIQINGIYFKEESVDFAAT